MNFHGDLTKHAPGARPPKTTFVKVPLGLALAASRATPTSKGMLVWLLIVYRCWKERKSTVAVTNAMMRKFEISPKVKVRALRCLERAGLVTVEWRDKKNPIVTLVVL